MSNGVMEKRLWKTANNLRANSKLRYSEYSRPVLGLIFLKYADYKFSQKKKEFGGEKDEVHFKAEGVLYLPEKSRYSYLLDLPEGADIGKAINEAMEGIESKNSELKNVLPKDYSKISDSTLITLLKTFNSIDTNTDGDVFGKIYEYFLGKFAMKEGQKGGEFYTPTSLVKLIVEIIEPYHGKIYDPATGSGGMFVQSAKFVKKHKKDPSKEIAIYGEEKIGSTVNLAKMNLSIHGLEGDIKEGNTYYEDLHDSVGKFDFVMANPPFNVSGMDKEKIKEDSRWPLGLPSYDNANYIWIQQFWSALNNKGRASFVMANSAADARGNSENIRQKLIEDEKVIDVMIAIGSNFFYTVTLPCTLWFLDKEKYNTNRENKVLFIDARDIYAQIDRAHREFIPAQIEYISNIARMYRGEKLERDFLKGMKEEVTKLNDRLEGLESKDKKDKEDKDEISTIKRDLKIIKGLEEKWEENFPENRYRDIKGLCNVASIEEIKEQNWSLTPGRYVGVKEWEEPVGFDFKEELKEKNKELQGLNKEADKLEELIKENVKKLIKG